MVVGEIFTPRNPAKRVAEAKGYTAMLGHYHLRGEEMDETCLLYTSQHGGGIVLEIIVAAHQGVAVRALGAERAAAKVWGLSLIHI